MNSLMQRDVVLSGPVTEGVWADDEWQVGGLVVMEAIDREVRDLCEAAPVNTEMAFRADIWVVDSSEGYQVARVGAVAGYVESLQQRQVETPHYPAASFTARGIVVNDPFAGAYQLDYTPLTARVMSQIGAVIGYYTDRAESIELTVVMQMMESTGFDDPPESETPVRRVATILPGGLVVPDDVDRVVSVTDGGVLKDSV